MAVRAVVTVAAEATAMAAEETLAASLVSEAVTWVGAVVAAARASGDSSGDEVDPGSDDSSKDGRAVPAGEREGRRVVVRRKSLGLIKALEDDDSDETEDVKATEASDGYVSRTQSRQGDKARLPRVD